MNNKSDRILYLDVARVIAVFWIVGYWHLRVYCGVSYVTPLLSFPGDEYITGVVLGLFMYLSGYFISKYTFVNFWEDAKKFLYKRLIRFYLLYAISVFLLFILGYNSHFGGLCLIKTLTVTSTYLLPQPRTLWFFSMLALFYIFTPFIMRKPIKSIGLFFSVIYAISLMLHFLLPLGIDSRFFWCFPIYCGGLFMGNKKDLAAVISTNKVGLIAFIVIAIQFALIYFCPLQYQYIQYFTLPVGIVFVLFVSRLVALMPVKWIVSKIAYCSMCAYLFHREIYMGLMEIYDVFSLDFAFWFSALTFLPICLICSYYIQWLYDKFVNHLLQLKITRITI